MKVFFYLSDEYQNDLIYGTILQRNQQIMAHRFSKVFTIEEFIEETFNGNLKSGVCAAVEITESEFNRYRASEIPDMGIETFGTEETGEEE